MIALCDLLQKALTHDDVDKSVCALVAFVQLELGASLDPEYGDFPTAELGHDALNDEDWDDGLAEMMAEASGNYDHFGRVECRKLIRFRLWEKTLTAPAKFEKTFPGMGHRQSNLARAMQPIFKHLDPVLDYHVLDLCLAWIHAVDERGEFEREPASPPATTRPVMNRQPDSVAEHSLRSEAGTGG